MSPIPSQSLCSVCLQRFIILSFFICFLMTLFATYDKIPKFCTNKCYSILKFIQAIFMESLNLSEIHFMQTQQNERIPRCFQCQSQTLCMPNHTHAAVAALLYPIYAFAHDTDQSFIGHKTSPAKHNVLGETEYLIFLLETVSFLRGRVIADSSEIFLFLLPYKT